MTLNQASLCWRGGPPNRILTAAPFLQSQRAENRLSLCQLSRDQRCIDCNASNAQEALHHLEQAAKCMPEIAISLILRKRCEAGCY